MIDLTDIIQAVIALIAAIVTYRVIPWVKARASTEQLEMLSIVTRTLVFAAEQIYGAGKGAEKLAYVKAQLESKGLKVDTDVIEAMVRELASEGAEQK